MMPRRDITTGHESRKRAANAALVSGVMCNRDVMPALVSDVITFA
jgi:hypothetical protein